MNSANRQSTPLPVSLYLDRVCGLQNWSRRDMALAVGFVDAFVGEERIDEFCNGRIYLGRMLKRLRSCDKIAGDEFENAVEQTVSVMESSGRAMDMYEENPHDSRFAVPREICFFCSYSCWAIGIGQGFYCRNDRKMDAEGIKPSQLGFRRFNIPSFKYVCEFFELKDQYWREDE